MMTSHRTDSDIEYDDFTIPKGVIRRKGGWEGDELEWDRSRTSTIDLNASAAVDLKQFRNEEVGKGYQAKHVIRQPSISQDQKLRTEDMSKTTLETTKACGSKKRKSKESERRKSDQDQHQRDQFSAKLAKYISCEAFCKFRQEIEKMV
jgi:hypothetical protein